MEDLLLQNSRVFGVNLKPIVNLSQVAAKKLIADGRPGAIVNVSSQASMRALADHTSYGASKAAMDQITRAMALELGPFGVSNSLGHLTIVESKLNIPLCTDPDKCNKSDSDFNSDGRGTLVRSDKSKTDDGQDSLGKICK